MTWLVEYLRRNGAMSAEEVIQEAADALDIQAGSIEAVQSVNARQAERIAELEQELKTAQEGWKCGCSTDDACRFARERDELRAAIISLLNKADNLSAEEVYGVIASVEVEVRLSMFAAMKQAQQKDTL